MATILIIEDDPNIRLTMEFALFDAGYKTMTSDNGIDGLSVALNTNPDLILLDLLLPDMDGKTLIKKFRRQNSETPVIIVTALSDDKDKVFCLDAGADDYISKPLSIDELLARIRANLRRSQSHQYALQQEKNLIQIGDLTVDNSNQLATVKGIPVKLRNLEMKILKVLSAHPEALVEREVLTKEVWTDEPEPSSRTVDVHIHNLRNAIEAHSDYEYITTEYGKGYRFQAIPKNRLL